MLTPVAKLFPGAQVSQHAQSPAARVETGPEGARAGLLAQPETVRRRHGDASAETRLPLVTEAYRGAGPRAATAPARRREQETVEGLIGALTRLDALEGGLRDAPFVVAAAGEGAEAVRLGGAPLLKPPRSATASLFHALTRLIESPDRTPAPLFGLGAMDDRLALAPGATVVVRVSAGQARNAAEMTATRRADGDVALAFEGGARLTVATGAGADAILAFEDGARLPLAPAPPVSGSGVDLRL